MNKIQAIIRPEKLNSVVSALEEIGCVGLTTTHVTGRGQQRGVQVFTGRGTVTTTVSLLPKVKIETVAAEADTERIIDAIVKSARSGEEGMIGDGKIFVSPVTDVIRVRTRERGAAAI